MTSHTYTKKIIRVRYWVDAFVYRDGTEIAYDNFYGFFLTSDISKRVYDRAHTWADRQIKLATENEHL